MRKEEELDQPRGISRTELADCNDLLHNDFVNANSNDHSTMIGVHSDSESIELELGRESSFVLKLFSVHRRSISRAVISHWAGTDIVPCRAGVQIIYRRVVVWSPFDLMLSHRLLVGWDNINWLWNMVALQVKPELPRAVFIRRSKSSLVDGRLS